VAVLKETLYLAFPLIIQFQPQPCLTKVPRAATAQETWIFNNSTAVFHTYESMGQKSFSVITSWRQLWHCPAHYICSATWICKIHFDGVPTTWTISFKCGF